MLVSEQPRLRAGRADLEIEAAMLGVVISSRLLKPLNSLCRQVFRRFGHSPLTKYTVRRP